MELAIGLMSGTSRDGIDAAVTLTDGLCSVEPVTFLFEPYSTDRKSLIADACRIALEAPRPYGHPIVDRCQKMLTDHHLVLCWKLLEDAGLTPKDIRIVGYHGHTLAHRADKGWTWQVGDATRSASR
jgi:anhydro-N-acetylmuramic acid kinase